MMRPRRMRAGCRAWVALGFLALMPIAFAQIPALIRYQGQAVDSQGVPLEGPYALTFRLYDAETAGAEVWKELQPAVPLSGGHFSVLLGSVTPLTEMDWSQPRWLSVQVGEEPELFPRQQITSVPLALRAQTAEQLTAAITPSLVTPQGAGSALDADTVDGQHAADLLNRAHHTGTQPSSTITGAFAPSVISPQGSGSGLDADMVDGLHVSQILSRFKSIQIDGRFSYPTRSSSNATITLDVPSHVTIIAKFNGADGGGVYVYPIGASLKRGETFLKSASTSSTSDMLIFRELLTPGTYAYSLSTTFNTQLGWMEYTILLSSIPQA